MALARTLIVARRLYAGHWRTLSTFAEPPSTKSSIDKASPESFSFRGRPTAVHNVRPDNGAKDSSEKLDAMHPRMIFVRPWDGIPTTAHAFAIIHEIERRFGRIHDFVILRDADVPSTSSPFMHVTFVSAKDANAIPLEGKVIQVVTPKVDKERDGGIGLDDLYVYLDPAMKEKPPFPQESEANQWGPPQQGQVMDVKLERTSLRGAPTMPPSPSRHSRGGPPHRNNPTRTQELAQAITAFGGFVDRPEHTQGDRTRMEAVLSRWTRMLRQTRSTELAHEGLVSGSVESSVEESTTRDVPWRPFEQEEPVSPAGLPSTVHSTPPIDIFTSGSPPVTSSSSTSLLTNPPPVSQKPKLSPSSWKEAPSQPSAPVEPTLSKKQRMFNAARLASAMQVEKRSTPAESSTHISSSLEAKSRVVEADHDPAASEEENKAAARKWWNFLTGGKG